MLCNNCNKNEATVHIQEFSGTEKKAVHLCSSCASALEVKSQAVDHLKLAALLFKLTSGAVGNVLASEDLLDKLGPEMTGTGRACSSCGMTEKEFCESGRVGCAFCYQDLRHIILPALEPMHRGLHHSGKRPGKPAEDQPRKVRIMYDLQQLEEELRQAVDHENYERAAEIRDLINQSKADD